jgi:hypothetical protein
MLPALANVVHQKLKENYRCLYLNSPPMVAGMNCCLAAKGVDVAAEVQRGSLLFSADQTHLTNGRFEIESMIRALEAGVEQALKDGYKGLWATGDMSWEFGSSRDFAKLLEYEWRLEQLFQKQPGLSGICQYHRETLPVEVMRQALLTHHSLFVNETLSRVNPQYVFQVMQEPVATTPSGVDGIINQLCALQPR